MPLGVCSQDALAEATGTAVHDQHEVTSVEPDPIRVLRIEKSLDTRQFHEVVAPAHRAQALGVTAKSIGIHHAPGWIVGVPSGIQCTVEIGEPAGETLGYGTFEVDGEHSDTAADVGSHQVRIQHSRRHGGTDGRAFPGVQAEERGQAEAIARSTKACLKLGVPMVAAIVGEGGSGGAIALATGNKVLMFEHAVYSVISPEGCASILWRTADKAADAAEAMKVTAQDLLVLGVIDTIVAEPLGGAHREPGTAIGALGDAIGDALSELSNQGPAQLRKGRREKFLAIGRT